MIATVEFVPPKDPKNPFSSELEQEREMDESEANIFAQQGRQAPPATPQKPAEKPATPQKPADPDACLTKINSLK
jgi:hypothetical protein